MPKIPNAAHGQWQSGFCKVPCPASAFQKCTSHAHGRFKKRTRHPRGQLATRNRAGAGSRVARVEFLTGFAGLQSPVQPRGTHGVAETMRPHFAMAEPTRRQPGSNVSGLSGTESTVRPGGLLFGAEGGFALLTVFSVTRTRLAASATVAPSASASTALARSPVRSRPRTSVSSAARSAPPISIEKAGCTVRSRTYSPMTWIVLPPKVSSRVKIFSSQGFVSSSSKTGIQPSARPRTSRYLASCP